MCPRAPHSTGRTSSPRDACFRAGTFQAASFEMGRGLTNCLTGKCGCQNTRLGKRAGSMSRQGIISSLHPVKEKSWEEGEWHLKTKEPKHMRSHGTDYLREDRLGKRYTVASGDRTLRDTGRGPPLHKPPSHSTRTLCLAMSPWLQAQVALGPWLGPSVPGAPLCSPCAPCRC